MKKILSLIVCSYVLALTAITAPYAEANDGAYYMSGNQLVPMHTTQIDVKKEVLNIRRDGEDILVDVHYELHNFGKPTSLLVGFEAMPPSGDVNGLPNNGEHPYMKDFTASINGKPLLYDVALVPTVDHWKNIDGDVTLGLTKAESPFYFQNGRIKQETESTLLARMGDEQNEVGELYVYHFSANFDSGKNVIDHSYRFEASGSVGEVFNFDYVLKAINRWGDSTIDDFQLTLDMGDMIEFNVLNTFFDNVEQWQLEGVGAIYPTPKNSPNYYYSDKYQSTTFAIKEGKVIFNKKNFTPNGDIFLMSPAYYYHTDVFNADVDDLSFNYTWFGDANSDDLDDFSRRVLRNFPFARQGYEFKDAKLQSYYQNQPWYIPDPSYQADFTKLTKNEQEYILQFNHVGYVR